MSTRKATRDYRSSQWFPIIKACHESGLSVRAWCKQNDVNEKQFYYWQRILRQTVSESLPAVQTSKFVQVPNEVSLSSKTTSSFIPSMIVHVGNATVEIAEHIDAELFASVIKVLSHV